MTLTVNVKEDGKEVLHFRIVRDKGKLYAERPHAPSVETQEGEDIYTTIGIALVNLKLKGTK